jgi:hypothetical protein
VSSSKQLLRAISKPVDVKKLLDRVSFDLDGLEEAGMEQPRLRLRAGRLKVQMMLRRAELKRHLASVIGKESVNIRHKHGNSYTATAIRNELGYNHDVRKAQKAFDTAEALESFADDIREVYKERSMLLFSLSRLKGSEISNELRAVKGQADMNHLRERARKMRDSYEDL